ncbi:hypothetical protein [Nocardioides litoris]|uniref:hypothetical protein n=1 Tax=Nocardioides litoris TaxID=1926648 RepID=UPI00111D57FA|nr:hypothetical protein [Nocardioides litoris]
MQELTDPAGVLTVRVHDGRLDSVLVRASWRDHHPDAESISRALTALVRRALQPAADRAPTTDGTDGDATWRPTLQPMDPARARVVWDEIHAHRRLLQRRRERARTDPQPLWRAPDPVADSQGRCFLGYDAAGRVDAIALSPRALVGATGQKLTDLLSETLRGVELDRSQRADPDAARLDEHRAAVRDLLRG